MTQLANKTILITGAAGGFGQEFARQLLARGNQLILTDWQAEPLAQLATNATGPGQVLAHFATDLLALDGPETLARQTQELDTPVDILINNAGTAVFGRVDEVPAEQWQRVVQLNLMVPMALSAAFAAPMIQRGSGHIVNISSVAGWTADIGLSAYAASKFGLRGFSETIAAELRPHNVKVSVAFPFFSRTPILNSPRFGSYAVDRPATDAIPGITEPAAVVAAMLAGIERDHLHIFPDRTGRTLYRLSRYTPRLFAFLRRRMTLANQLPAN
ncbi:MAG: SDR family oxidoreductase [Anaerolineales bacterium]|nr:SDR family oxidoreductase [Anaerolineales bacterium]